MSDPELPVSDSAVNTGPGVSGKWVILGIFAFAICATGGLWVYTWMHHARFFEYRKALVAEFTKKSVPRVDGGREKGHGPEILRVVLNVEFDVLQDDPATVAQKLDIERRAFRLAEKHVDLKMFERWEFTLIQLVPEANPLRYESKRSFAEARQALH